VVESTRLQLAIRRHWKHQVTVDWAHGTMHSLSSAS
jgi:hypothetical protein